MPRSLRPGLLAAVLTTLLAVPASASAITLTVDPADANNACTRGSDNVCKTITQAVGAAQASDTIQVLKGTYPEAVTIGATLNDLTLIGEADVRLTGSGTDPTLSIASTGVNVKDVSIESAGSAVVIGDGASATFTNLIGARTAASSEADPLIDSTGTIAITNALLLQQTGALATPAVRSAGAGGAQLADVIAANFVGPVVAMSASDKNTIARSTLLAGEATDAGSDAVQLLSANAGARKLVVDSSILVGGLKAAGLLVKTSGNAAGDAELQARHVTIAGASKGIVLDGTGAAGPGLPTPAAVGNIAATVAASIVHPVSSATGYESPDFGLATTSNAVTLGFTDSDAPPATAGDSATVDMGNATNTEDAKLFAKGFTLRTDAPVIDKGGPLAAGESTKDVQGENRVEGAATDIGADEFINKAPKADFGVTSATPKENEAVGFVSSSSDPEELDGAGGGLAEFQWDFGDGTKQTTNTGAIAHTYTKIGTYTVTLVVKDKQGLASKSASKTVTVTDGTAPAVSVSTPAEGASFRLNPLGPKPKAKKGSKKKKRKRKLGKPLPLTMLGKASDASGVTKVEVSLYMTRRTAKGKKLAKGQCSFYSGRLFARKACDKEIWLPATIKGDSWELVTKRGVRLVAGRYEVRVRATDGTGLLSSVFSTKEHTLVHFRVR